LARGGTKLLQGLQVVFDLRIEFRLVVEIEGQSGVDLSQRKVCVLLVDFIRTPTIPAGARFLGIPR